MQNSFKKVQEIHDLWTVEPSKFQILIQQKNPPQDFNTKTFVSAQLVQLSHL